MLLRQIKTALGMVVSPDDGKWRLVPPGWLFSLPTWESYCRRLTTAVAIDPDRVLCRTLARYKMYVSPKDNGLGPHLMLDGYWEAWNTRVMAETVKPGMVCIDAGANIGYFTVLMADLAGPTGKVVAAEPIPATRSLLQQNIDVNGFGNFTTVTGDAFGAEAGQVNLFVPPGEPKNALILDVDTYSDWEKHSVPVTPIDDLGLDRVDFVKIDVEGAEMDVWRGMQKTLDRNPQITIMMEVNCARYPNEAPAFLRDIEARFPLRSVEFSGRHVSTTAEAVMAYPDDVTLYLKRG
jgi:FkbM family methyltransferase